ncbi:hypothetical protein [Actinocorallia lasiicapitis]
MTRSLAVVGASLGLCLLTAVPAAASPVSYGWEDNDRLCRNSPCVTGGNVVQLWQNILIVSWRLPNDTADGEFGPYSEYWTQKLWGSATVTSQMWMNVSNNLRSMGPDCVGRQGSEYYRLEVSHADMMGTDILDLRMSCSNGVWSFLDHRTWSWIRAI